MSPFEVSTKYKRKFYSRSRADEKLCENLNNKINKIIDMMI